ncbi:MAG: DJ-1/PfpI family protein [Solirubrobacteraceae bacterium]
MSRGGSIDYDACASAYSSHRRADPRIAAHIEAALGDARTVLNVGAGTGSYEPDDRDVIAVEPSAGMRAERPADLAPTIGGRADLASGLWDERHGELRRQPTYEGGMRLIVAERRRGTSRGRAPTTRSGSADSPSAKPTLRVGVLLYEGFDELDAIGPYEVLCMARAQTEAEVSLVSAAGPEELTASNGATIRSQAALNEDWDVVVVPGGGWARRQGAFVAVEAGELPQTLAAMHARGVTMAAVCTGAMLLAAAGITASRPAVTHRSALEDLRATGAQIVEARVVDDGDVVTTGGITSGIDLGLWLVERFWGRKLADAVAERLEHARVGEVHRGPRSTRRG